MGRKANTALVEGVNPGNLELAARFGSRTSVTGYAFADSSRGIVVGPYASSEEALEQSRVHGHSPGDVTVFQWVNRFIWDATLQMTML